MKENFSGKYRDVLAGMNEADAEYILRCIRESGREIDRISARLDAFNNKILQNTEQLEKAENSYFDGCKRICALVKKYNDTLVNDGIWNSVEDSEKKKKLNTFYSLASAIEKVGEKGDFSPVDEELISYSTELGKIVSLLKRASYLLEDNAKNMAQAAISKYILCNSMAEQIIKEKTSFIMTVQKNEATLGNLILSLAMALDEKNSGERMNPALARKCAEVFLINYITEK